MRDLRLAMVIWAGTPGGAGFASIFTESIGVRRDSDVRHDINIFFLGGARVAVQSLQTTVARSRQESAKPSAGGGFASRPRPKQNARTREGAWNCLFHNRHVACIARFRRQTRDQASFAVASPANLTSFDQGLKPAVHPAGQVRCFLFVFKLRSLSEIVGLITMESDGSVGSKSVITQ